MHPKISNIILGIIILLGISGLIMTRHNSPVSDIQTESIVRNQVTQFGESLKMVSILAPTTTVSKTMDESYASFVAPELLAKWKNDPMHSPGRLTSSPSPDRIEIYSVVKKNNDEYAVNGRVIETSSTDQPGSNSGSYPVNIVLESRNNAWLITSFAGYPPSN